MKNPSRAPNYAMSQNYLQNKQPPNHRKKAKPNGTKAKKWDESEILSSSHESVET